MDPILFKLKFYNDNFIALTPEITNIFHFLSFKTVSELFFFKSGFLEKKFNPSELQRIEIVSDVTHEKWYKDD